MSVLIKGMSMPKSCAVCKLRMVTECCGNLPRNTRMPNCPLVPVPPHGRLIDADALTKANEKTYDNFKNGDEISLHEAMIAYLIANGIIQRSPAIIPAEREGE